LDNTLGLYIHNDTIVAFGEQEKQILIEPVFGQIIQESSGKACACEPCARYCKSFDSFIMPLGPGDLLAHHAIALGLHVTILILLKGSLENNGCTLAQIWYRKPNTTLLIKFSSMLTFSSKFNYTSISKAFGLEIPLKGFWNRERPTRMCGLDL